MGYKEIHEVIHQLEALIANEQNKEKKVSAEQTALEIANDNLKHQVAEWIRTAEGVTE